MPSAGVFLFGLLGATVGGLLLNTTEVAHAEAALPAINVDNDANNAQPTKKKAGGRKKQKQRKLLEYPGKLGKIHQSAEQVVNVPVGQAMRIQLQLSAYPHDPHADKSVLLIPMFELGGQQGPVAQLVAMTSLGRSQTLEGYCDSMGNVTGHYKYLWDSGFSVKPSFQMTGNGNMFVIDADWKGREQAITLTLPASGEITSTYNQALTPNLVGGVELHYIPMHSTILNGGMKYTSSDKIEQFAVSKKDAKYTARSAQQPTSTHTPTLHFRP